MFQCHVCSWQAFQSLSDVCEQGWSYSVASSRTQSWTYQPRANIKNFFHVRNRLECLSLADLSSLVYGLQVRWSLTLIGVTERCFTRVDSSFTHKHQTRQARQATDKHSSLLRKFENYRKKLKVLLARNTLAYCAPSLLTKKKVLKC